MAGWTLDGAKVSVTNFQLTAGMLRDVGATNSTLMLQPNAVLNNTGDTSVIGGGLAFRLAGGKITGGRLEGVDATSAIAADRGTLEDVTVAASITNWYVAQPFLQTLTIAGTFAMEPNRAAPVSMTVDGQAVFSSGSVSTIKGTLAGTGTASLNSNAQVAVESMRGIKASIASGATLALMPSAQGGGLSHVPSISLSAGATLDVADVPIIVDFWTSPRFAIAAAYAAGAWTGTGVSSSYAATHPGTAIGYASAGSLLGTAQNPAGTILGETVAPEAKLIRLTAAGDSNLDGLVNFTDLLQLARNYNASPTSDTWCNGDFNYDGLVNFADLLTLTRSYGITLAAPPPPAPASVAPTIAPLSSTIVTTSSRPKPTTLFSTQPIPFKQPAPPRRPAPPKKSH